MPRVSRSVSQRYANASKKKPKRREGGHATILPPQIPTAAVELPAGVGSPQVLDLPGDTASPQPTARAARPTGRADARLAARRGATAPNIDYSDVAGDLRRIGMVAGLLLLVLIALTFVPGLH